MENEDTIDSNEEVAKMMDPSVPSDLLELHVALEDKGITPEEFRKAYDL